MATTQKGGVSEAACPLCDDYTGEPSSVEAHISRMTDPVHQGEVGRAHRDDLHRQVEATDGVESSDDRAVETSDEETTGPDFLSGGGLQSEDSDTEGEDAQEDDEMPTDEELDRQRSQLVEDGDDQEAADDQLDVDDDRDDRDDRGDVDVGGDPAGIPIPVSTGTLVVGLVALFAVYWFVLRSGGSDGSGDQEQEQNRQESQQPPQDGFGGGLIGESVDELQEAI